MRKKKIYFALAASFLLVLLLVGGQCINTYMDYRVPVNSTGRVMGIAIVENLDFLEGKEVRTSAQNPGVVMNGALLPYDSDGVLYLAQDFDKEAWEGDLLTNFQDTFLCTIPDAAWNDKPASIREGHAFSLWLVGEDFYYELKMVACGMPVMSITTEYSEEQDLGDYETDPDRFHFDPDELFYGDVQVFDPGDETRRYDIFESGVRYYLRGASSSSFEKQSYSLCLLDSRGEKLDKALLGMRSDNSWKLKAMVADSRKIRERTACQLWEQFDLTNTGVNEAGPRMEYLELVIDNDYVGLYGIVEPVDEKKLGLDKNDVLYKSTNWKIPEDEDIQYAVDRQWKIMTYIRLRYPQSITDYGESWYPMRDYLNTFYRGEGDDYPAETKLNLTNYVDALLFNMTISGSDNHFRNLYFAADVNEDGTYSMRQIPWDLDLTFTALVGNAINDDETVVYEEAALPFLRDIKPEVVRPVLQKRWAECRETFLSTDNILQIMRDNQQYLINSGVVERENERWPDYRMNTDIDKIEDYQIRRMEWLDSYFEEF